MAITRSSRAITSTERYRIGRAGLLIAGMSLALGGFAWAVLAMPAARPPAPPPAAAAAPPVEKGGDSFFDPFDRLDGRRWMVSDGWTNGEHQGCTWSRANVNIAKGVLQMTLGKANDRLRPYRCAEFKTNEHFGYGTYEARMRTAAGSGLNTAIFTYLNNVHDELDFEFLGRDPGSVQINYFTSGQGGHETVPKLGFDASAAFNDYAFVWGPDSARWYVNGRLVREVKGSGLPVNPGSLFLTLWNGTQVIDGWLGPMDTTRTPALAEVDWVAFTRAGERCRFPTSVTCKLP